jgi:hypothetical protein
MIRRRAISLLVAALTLTLPAGLVSAEDGQPTPEVTAGATAVDLLVARPGGLAAMVLGTTIFVVGLPFTLINGSTEQAAQQLIGDPASYTFARPLGQDLGGLGHPQQ